MACAAKECVLDLLKPVYGDDAGDVALEVTCFPMNCDVACQQARELLARVEVVGPDAALAEAMKCVYEELETAMTGMTPDPSDETGRGR